MAYPYDYYGSYAPPQYQPPQFFNYDPNAFAPNSPYDQTYRGDGTGRLFPSTFMDPANYGNKESRMQFNSYSDNALQPYLDYYLRAGDQRFTQQYNAATLAEQQYMNRIQSDLAMRGSSREDQAFALQKAMDARNYQEDVRRFNQQYGYANRELDLQRQLGMGNLGVSRQQAQTGQYGAETERMLGQGNLALNRQLGMGQLGVSRYGAQTERMLGQGNLDVNRYGAQTERLGTQGQLDLGRGRLSLDTRTADQENAYRYSALDQEAKLMREKYQNDLQQTTMSTFGRDQQPQYRTLNQWR